MQGSVKIQPPQDWLPRFVLDFELLLMSAVLLPTALAKHSPFLLKDLSSFPPLSLGQRAILQALYRQLLPSVDSY